MLSNLCTEDKKWYQDTNTFTDMCATICDEKGTITNADATSSKVDAAFAVAEGPLSLLNDDGTAVWAIFYLGRINRANARCGLVVFAHAFTWSTETVFIGCVQVGYLTLR